MFIHGFHLPSAPIQPYSPVLPRPAALFAQPPVTNPQSVAPNDSVALSQEAQQASLPVGAQNLMMFGGDRRTAIETLVASGAKAENPKLGFFKNTLRKVFGGTKSTSREISADQTLSTRVKTKNFRLKDLRLTTHGEETPGGETRRHIDFQTRTADGKKAQVKHIGEVIGKGTPSRMFEQDITYPQAGQQGKVVNTYFDPKSGQEFLRTTEVANRLGEDKGQTVKSHKDRQTFRQIDLLDSEGRTNQRYVFDYGARSIRLEHLDHEGQVSSSQALSKKTDYNKLVQRLSTNPPSAQPAAMPQGIGGLNSNSLNTLTQLH